MPTLPVSRLLVRKPRLPSAYRPPWPRLPVAVSWSMPPSAPDTYRPVWELPRTCRPVQVASGELTLTLMPSLVWPKDSMKSRSNASAAPVTSSPRCASRSCRLLMLTKSVSDRSSRAQLRSLATSGNSDARCPSCVGPVITKPSSMPNPRWVLPDKVSDSRAA